MIFFSINAVLTALRVTLRKNDIFCKIIEKVLNIISFRVKYNIFYWKHKKVFEKSTLDFIQ